MTWQHVWLRRKACCPGNGANVGEDGEGRIVTGWQTRKLKSQLVKDVPQIAQLKIVFEAIAEPMTPPEEPRKKIGFGVKEKRASYGKRGKKRVTSGFGADEM